MWIPDALYKVLPFIYALTGAALIPIFGFSGPSMCSAILLLSAGILTSLWRYRNQEDAPASPQMNSVREEWEKRKERRTESMPLDGFQ